ncbi:ATPase [Candidatus Woesearchaeota archaeon]|nr:ATPase [Nanoarchaeota archaeon]MCB9370634.1 ATPase [Candidatus Woesearchaeota archaeon]USN43718.1 MAG: ATPase [Candidatus Woesearchaeota archaeon]
MAVESLITTEGMQAFSAGLAFGLAAIGTGLAQKEAIAAAIGAISEDPKLFAKALIFAVLPETILIFGFLVIVMIKGV